MIQDYFDGHYIFCIDPKPDYDEMTQRLGGANIILGRKNSRDKGNKTLNIWDVLTVPNDTNDRGEEVALSPLDKTYIKNDGIIAALLNLKGKADEEEIMAA
jgi:hypothetical protein